MGRVAGRSSCLICGADLATSLGNEKGGVSGGAEKERGTRDSDDEAVELGIPWDTLVSDKPK